MSQLLIDIGNTFIHWALKAPGQTLSAMQSYTYRDENIETLLDRHWTELKSISEVLICSVAAKEINLSVQRWVQQRWQITPQYISSEASNHGIQNAYAEPQNLGADRWAAMVAAYHLSQKACGVLDCGTAVTFDVIDTSGQHLGGWIMPGYRLFRQSLSLQAAGIGVSTDTSVHMEALGIDTQQCVDIGWHQGVAGLIQNTLAEVQLTQMDCFITGGDAQRLLPLLGGKWCYANDLVLQGLAIIASPG